MRLLRQIARLWSLIRRPSSVSVDAPRWSPDDSRSLAAFLRSDEGVRLGAVLRDRLALAASSAINSDPSRLAWSCGHAAGMQSAVALLDSLSVEPDSHAPAHDDRPSDTLDWLNPQPRTANA